MGISYLRAHRHPRRTNIVVLAMLSGDERGGGRYRGYVMKKRATNRASLISVVARERNDPVDAAKRTNCGIKTGKCETRFPPILFLPLPRHTAPPRIYPLGEISRESIYPRDIVARTSRLSRRVRCSSFARWTGSRRKKKRRCITIRRCGPSRDIYTRRVVFNYSDRGTA